MPRHVHPSPVRRMNPRRNVVLDGHPDTDRGIGKQGQTEAQDPSVGVVVDGVNYAYNALISSYDFTDVDTVELARGPQGTLQGKNATLGILNITTRRPSFTPDAQYSVTVGQLGTVIGRAAGGGPVTDDLLAWRGTLSAERGKGDVRNLNNPDDTYQNKDRVTGRLQDKREQRTWNQSMRGERKGTKHDRGVLDGVMLISVSIALALFGIWFFAFAGSSIPGS